MEPCLENASPEGGYDLDGFVWVSPVCNKSSRGPMAALIGIMP